MFTLAEAIGEGVFLEGGEGLFADVAIWVFFLEYFSAICVCTEPSIPSPGGSVTGLDGSVVGRGAWGIKSYKVRY